MNIAYLIYQAERPRTATEARDEAIRNGELAKALSDVLRGRRRARRAAQARPAYRAERPVENLCATICARVDIP
jgi:hypothetical protein